MLQVRRRSQILRSPLGVMCNKLCGGDVKENVASISVALEHQSRLILQRLPNSAAGPSYKLTLPHQIVHKFLLHLIDADIELASHPTARQVWHGSIAPRRNKERSEFTLQVQPVQHLL